MDKGDQAREGDLVPIACMEKQKGALRLSSLDVRAEHVGLAVGQGVAEARAMCPDLALYHQDHEADMAFLNALADWADRYTPLIGLDAPFNKAQGLFLDIEGCAHLFGGEAEMLKDMIMRLRQMGVCAQGAIAPTPGLAWGLARQDSFETYQPDQALMRWEDVDQKFPSFPMAALRLPLDMLVALDRVGLKYVKDILNAPRKPLTKRFGPLLLKRLGQALGAEDEPISPRLPIAALSVERRLAEPIGRQEDIETCIDHLSHSLKKDMEQRGLAGQRFMVHLFRMDGAVRRIDVGLSAPSRDPKRIKALFSERLSHIYDQDDAGVGFETVRLSVLTAVDFSDVQASLDGQDETDATLYKLADQMTMRLGADQVLKPQLYDSYIPERAASFVPIAYHKLHEETLYQSHPNRPMRLFERPEPVIAIAEVPEGPPIRFRWRRSQYHVVRAEGPERISSDWYMDGESAPTRDYYRVEDKSGRRFWLFRKGLYDRASETLSDQVPQWFMHGLFA